MFNKFTTKNIVLIIILDFIVAVATIVLYVYNLIPKTLFTILLFTCLMGLSLFLSMLTDKYIRKKIDINKNTKKYEIKKNYEILIENNSKHFDVNYGYIDIKTTKNTIFCLKYIIDPNVLFSDKAEKVDFKINEKQYKYCIEFYVFQKKDINMIRKIKILNYQGKKFYIGSFIVDYEQGSLTQTDYISPNNDYKTIYEEFLKIIGVVN